MSVKPFSKDRNRFYIHNAVFDVIMPRSSPNGFKILCVAIRQTLGWVETIGGDPRNRKPEDIISYSQFTKKSGIVSRSTVSKAIKECLSAGYLLRRQVGYNRGKPVYAYRLNQDYELTGTETVPLTGTETVPLTGTETVPLTGTETVLTNTIANTNKEKVKEKAAGSPSEKIVMCSIHRKEMTRRTKDGATWFSHLHEGSWCKGENGDVKPKLETSEDRRRRYAVEGVQT